LRLVAWPGGAVALIRLSPFVAAHAVFPRGGRIVLASVVPRCAASLPAFRGRRTGRMDADETHEDFDYGPWCERCERPLAEHVSCVACGDAEDSCVMSARGLGCRGLEGSNGAARNRLSAEEGST
jgi:hypothetical protein